MLSSIAGAMVFGSLASHHALPYYQTVERYKELTGKTAPAYDQAYPGKAWEDPNPPSQACTTIGQTGCVDEEGNAMYLGLALGKDGKTPLVRDGKPYLKAFKVPLAIAARVNIAPKYFDRNIPDIPQPMGEYQVPLRPLADDEEFAFGFGGIPKVQKKAAAAAPASGAPAASDELVKRLTDLIELLTQKVDLLIATSGK